MPTSHVDHCWSIAVEMQMYLFSPWLMMKFYNAKSEWMVFMVPVAICLVSTIVNLIMTAETMPKFFESGDPSLDGKQAEVDHFRQAYMPFYTRMSPYGFGMFAAYKHLAEVKRNKKSTNHEDVEYMLSMKVFVLELISFGIIVSCIWTGFIAKLVWPEL